MKQLNTEDLDHLALGAAILGSGGGGSPTYNRMITEHMMNTHGPIKLVDCNEICDEDLIAPVAFMGAPLVGLEKIASGKEFPAIFKNMHTYLGKKPDCILPAEIGGANAFTPLWTAALCQIPVLDADLIGRAFPELQMSVCSLKGISASPAFMADCLGNSVIFETLDAHHLERIARQNAIAMGSRAAVSLHLMSGRVAKNHVIKNSITRAISIGQSLETGIESFLKHTNGHKICSGTIIDIDQKVEGGFLKGSARIASEIETTLLYQNEYLIAYQQNKAVAVTPDVIVLLEQDSNVPITSDALRYGQRVEMISFKADPLWYTPEGMNLVGPKYFGYGDVSC